MHNQINNFDNKCKQSNNNVNNQSYHNHNRSYPNLSNHLLLSGSLFYCDHISTSWYPTSAILANCSAISAVDAACSSIAAAIRSSTESVNLKYYIYLSVTLD